MAENDGDHDDDDLYGDLEASDDKVAASGDATTSTTTTTRPIDNKKGLMNVADTHTTNSNRRNMNYSSNNSNRPRSLVEEVDVLQQRVAELQAENETLQRNMGTLYRTAMSELARKDKQLASLQAQLDERQQPQHHSR
jgi:hypothetical protein